MFGLAVLSGEPLAERDLRAYVERAALVMAADGGARHLWPYHLVPEAIVGDLDSSSPDLFPEVPRIRIDDQGRSDADKVLEVLGERTGRVMLACIHGGRVDHLLASFHSALATRLEVRWVLPQEYGALVRAGETIRPDVRPGTRLSILPLQSSMVSARGLAWPLDHASLALGRHISLSNEVENDPEITVHEGAVWLSDERQPGEVFVW